MGKKVDIEKVGNGTFKIYQPKANFQKNYLKNLDRIDHDQTVHFLTDYFTNKQ